MTYTHIYTNVARIKNNNSLRTYIYYIYYICVCVLINKKCFKKHVVGNVIFKKLIFFHTHADKIKITSCVQIIIGPIVIRVFKVALVCYTSRVPNNNT